MESNNMGSLLSNFQFVLFFKIFFIYILIWLHWLFVVPETHADLQSLLQHAGYF